MNIVIHGMGKMGKALASSASNQQDVAIVGKVGKHGGLSECIEKAGVIIDFSFHECTGTLAEACASWKKPLVIGTTGHSVAELQAISACATRIPIVKASNFSTGMNVLFSLVEKAVKTLGLDFDIEIVEMHHRLKKDAPSGTAATIAGILVDILDEQCKPPGVSIVEGRSGITGERSQREIGVHAVRGGDVFGDHTVIFAGDGERLEVVHKASSREAFARGALLAAKWIVGKKPGLYNMHDILGLHMERTQVLPSCGRTNSPSGDAGSFEFPKS